MEAPGGVCPGSLSNFPAYDAITMFGGLSLNHLFVFLLVCTHPQVNL